VVRSPHVSVSDLDAVGRCFSAGRVARPIRVTALASFQQAFPFCGTGRVSMTDPLDPPTWVIRIWAPLSARVLHRPGQGVVGDLLPAVLGGQQVGVAGVFLDLGHGVGLVMLGVGALDAGGHEVVLAARDEQQWRPVVVVVVDEGVLVARLQSGQRGPHSTRTDAGMW
jgi:hypothetical protein